jgi:hypothetical protein
MSVHKISPIIAEVVGRVGNTVYYPGRGGRHIARVRYMEGPGTKQQKAWRAVYSVVDQLYRDLTDGEREAWAKLNWTRAQSGYSKFMRCNLMRARDGRPLKRKP